ncbi:MAG: hypothetical protein VX341_11725 [Bdellovibrionota bacterium]|nr:hypothetical protein [Bdellovibrionota bacterium]
MNKNEKLDFYIGVAMWIGLSDGDLAQAEKVMILRRLKKLFPYQEDLEAQINKYEIEFKQDYSKSLKSLKKRMENSLEANMHKKNLIDFATKIIIDDQIINDQEELTMEEINNFFASFSYISKI